MPNGSSLVWRRTRVVTIRSRLPALALFLIGSKRAARLPPMQPFTLAPANLRRLTAAGSALVFDCGDADLNDFLINDARHYTGELLTVTYLVVDGKEIAAFFSLSNDTLTCDPNPDHGTKTIWNRLSRKIPNEKRRTSYPAVKLGRLGVASQYQRCGLGSDILDLLKMSFVCYNKTGCRFITVDAYNNPEAIDFYQRNEFDFLTLGDENDDTRQMYYDLKPFYLLNATSGQQLSEAAGSVLQNVPSF
jgi:ribosomal protein S18 acetylase RimI-like enzyme